MVDCPRIISFDASSTVDPDPIDAFKSYDEIEGSTIFILPMLKKNVKVFVSFLFMIFVFNFRMIFIFCPILTFRSSLFIVNSILTFYRYCFYFIYTDIAYMIYYNFLMVLTNSLSDIPSKLGSCFYVFQTMFLTVNFLHPTENLIQCPFQQAGILFFGSWCFCIISKRSYVLNNFRNYFHAKAFQKPLTILFNNFFLCLLRLLPYFLIISFFLICVYYVLSVLHASYLHVCFVNISAYIPTEIPTRLSNLFYTNSFIFIFVDVNVDVEYAIHSDLVLCNNFINYKVLPAFDFYFISLEPSVTSD